MSSMEDKPNQKPADEAQDNHQNNFPSPNSDGGGKPRLALFLAEVFLAGVLGLILWPLSDHFSQNGYLISGTTCRFLSIISFAAIAPILALKFWRRRSVIFSVYFLLCIVVLIVMFRTSHEGSRDVPNLENQMRFTGELDDPIRRVFLIFRLSQTNKFDELRPMSGGVDLESTMNDGHANGFKLSFTDGDRKLNIGGSNRSVVCYKTQLEVGDRIVRTQELVLRRTNILTIGILMPFRPDEIPFKKLRDFHNSMLVVHLSSNLTNKISSIEFVVNGWSIFHKATQGDAWWRPVGESWT